MSRIFSGIRSRSQKKYDFWRLVNHRIVDDFGHGDASVQFIFDIDKTYLETEFESLLKIAKIAFEKAPDKITVEGAPDVINALRWGRVDEPQKEDSPYPRPVHFVSSSPPQLREVLEHKLTLDGIDWSTDTFKDQAYNIRRRRFDLIKYQVTYKTAAILNVIKSQPLGTSFYMVGDSAESDAYIYLGLKLYLDGSLSKDHYDKYLQLGGVSKAETDMLLSDLPEVGSSKISGILIRDLYNYEFIEASGLTDQIFLFGDYFDAVLFFMAKDLIDQNELEWFVEQFRSKHSFSQASLRNKIEWFLGNKLIRSDFGDKIVQDNSEWGKNVPTHFQLSCFQEAQNPLQNLSSKEVFLLCQSWIKAFQKKSPKK